MISPRNIFVLCILLTSISGSTIPRLVPQPYFDVILDRFEQVYANTSYADFSNLKIRRVNKTRCLVGYADIKIPFGNAVLVENALYIKQGGEYRQMPYRLPPKGLCDFNAEDEYIYPDWAKNSDYPLDIKKNCPLKPKRYEFRCVYPLLEKAPKAAFRSGDYAAEAIYFKDNVKFLSYKIYGQIHNI